jgi:hypothetical protein
MGLVKTRWRLAEDGSPHRAARPESAPYQAVWKCCQCGSVASSNVASFQLGIEIGHWQRGQRLHEMGAAEVGGAMGASHTAFVCY